MIQGEASTMKSATSARGSWITQSARGLVFTKPGERRFHSGGAVCCLLGDAEDC